MPQCNCKIIDTFPAFIKFWDKAQKQSLDKQTELWVVDYMSKWPELLDKQQKDYADQGIDWQVIAREKVFPFLSERLPLMIEARRSLWACVELAYQKAQQALGLDFDVIFVIYVGIGCGAGWATSFQGKPACLFGLENVAECGYTKKEALAGLTAHELGHLFHEQRRVRHGLASGQGPFWQLYEEGFAVRCERMIMGKKSWHEQHDHNQNQEDWLSWCIANKAWLAAEFLRVVDEGRAVNPFFGSWYEIQGRSGCGHFLGYGVIREWEDEIGFNKVTLLSWDEVQRRARNSLEKMAHGGSRDQV